MTTKVNNSTSSNLDDKEEDYIEKEFVKENINELPIPKKGSEKYEKEILEVMKCGCNRHIAEYVILQYEELEKEKKDKILLWELRKTYENYLNLLLKRQ